MRNFAWSLFMVMLIASSVVASEKNVRGSIDLEPFPKSSFLASRDNIMIGWGAVYPEAFGQAIGLATECPGRMPELSVVRGPARLRGAFRSVEPTRR